MQLDREDALVTELGYFTIGVPEVARAQKFYGALFGWTFSDVSEEYAHVNNTKLPFGLNRGAAADLSSFYFRVENIEPIAAKVKALGGSVGEITKSPSGLGSLCTDDQGVKFNLWQPAEGY
jgi:predicted enzyme related to lactoylglutathione lyase